MTKLQPNDVSIHPNFLMQRNSKEAEASKTESLDDQHGQQKKIQSAIKSFSVHKEQLLPFRIQKNKPCLKPKSQQWHNDDQKYNEQCMHLNQN